MSDLVERLRDRAHDKRPMPKPFNLLLDASEEIERLQSEKLAWLEASVEQKKRAQKAEATLAEAQQQCYSLREIIADKTSAYETLREAFDLRTAELAEARRQAFMEAADIAASSARDLRNGDAYRFASSHIAASLRAKAE